MNAANRPSILTYRSSAADTDAKTLKKIVEQIAETWILHSGVKRLLLVPPDHTRKSSYAGEMVAQLWSLLAQQVSIDVLPAIGTHHPMTTAQLRTMFGESIPRDRFIDHDWRNDLELLGEIPCERVAQLTDGLHSKSIAVAVNKCIVNDDYDLVLSIGQVVPHEVVGYANHSKNLCIGCGGGDMLHQSHLLGALCGIEQIIGVVDTPVRRLIDEGFYKYVRPRADVRFILTVVDSNAGGLSLAAISAGEGRHCFQWAADVSATCNTTTVDHPIQRAVAWLAPGEFSSTWVANKAIYRLRKAMAPGGELIIIAPGVASFGEDDTIDKLVRRYGYRGTAATLDALEHDSELRANPSAAAHLIHGSSNGSFHITYCTGSGLSAEEVRGVGYEHRDVAGAIEEFGLTSETPEGWHRSSDGSEFYFVRNPAVGLWQL